MAHTGTQLIVASSVFLLLVACGSSSERPRTDAGGGSDGGSSDGGNLDTGVATDAGPDGCPSDIGSAEGMPCAMEGLSCGGPCTDVCSFCNILRCESGSWTRLEAFPAPCFACGDDTRCVGYSEYCAIEYSDVGGVPDVYECRDLPSACTAEPSCTCLQSESIFFDACTDGEMGAVTVEAFGG